jgi:hypothetical protein
MAFLMLSGRRRNDSDMHYQALQAEYSEGLLHRQVSLAAANVAVQAVWLQP